MSIFVFSMLFMFSIRSHSIGNTGIRSPDSLYIYWHFNPYENHDFVAKLTASPILRPVEKPPWYAPGYVTINSPCLYKVLKTLTPYESKYAGETIVVTSYKIFGSFSKRS